MIESTYRNQGKVVDNMRYTINNKTVNIPDKEIEKSMKVLQLTKEEAIQMYLEDEGIVDNEVQEELTKKQKENKVKIRGDAKKRTTSKPRTVKTVEEKKELYNYILQCLKERYGEEAVEEKNVNKILMLIVGDKLFKIDIIKTSIK
jgi:hypothetical protein